MHISSLPGSQGIGTLGKSAREFADFLQAAGQSFWQVLPVCPTSYGDSPYQSFSCEAGNPYFIDLDELESEGLLVKSEYADMDWESGPDTVNYGALYEKRFPILWKAAERFLCSPDSKFDGFLKENAWWLDEYALFMVIKDLNGGKAWLEWEEPLREREPEALEECRRVHAREIEYWKVIQYLFFSQWQDLKKYVNERGIQIIGDLPIYVSLDSVDVWAHPELFQLGEDGLPSEVSGCPPDGFTADGQLWGNPLYDWEFMKEDGYRWWSRRIRYQCNMFDILRIDHFRGFESYYAIPYGDKTARNGKWRPGPGIELFRKVDRVVGKGKIIAENLGFLTPEVEQMLEDSGYPGMKVLEFAFDSRDSGGNQYLPHNYEKNCIAYVGTHDNDTALGWYAGLPAWSAEYAKRYLGLNEEEGFGWGMMRNVWLSRAETAIVQAQDLLELGSEARMNTPSTLGGNWCWRAIPGSFSKDLAEKLHFSTEIYGRLPDAGAGK